MLNLSGGDLPRSIRARSVTALLGPTNTGKTHFALTRMLAHKTGMIGVPLRLLAREVYNSACARVGETVVALVTGEEKIIPAEPRYWVATLEALPFDKEVAFLALDEVQLAADPSRGHIFTRALLNARGTEETLFLGAMTIRPLLEQLIPGLNLITRPRLSALTYSGSKKITRLPPRSAVIVFSVEEVYTVAELIRHQKGGAAVVLGALSPRTRNAQVALFQSGQVDFLVATDAIGMGLNLEIDHVAFAAREKFDGKSLRTLNPAELAQIAGRAGRHLRDGTFGVTAGLPPFSDEVVARLESHQFPPLTQLQWRNCALDFRTPETLFSSLQAFPSETGLMRGAPASDLLALTHVMQDPFVQALSPRSSVTQCLWEVCQIPDYHKISPAYHAGFVLKIFKFLQEEGRIPEAWFAHQVSLCDKVEGDLDTLSARLAQIRSWTFLANRAKWLEDPLSWRQATREVEDRLSDALHERLMQRFVNRRTSVLMQKMKEEDRLETQVTEMGEVLVEGQTVGHLQGLQFVLEPASPGVDRKTLREVAARALVSEMQERAARLIKAPDSEFVLSAGGVIRWQGTPIARLVSGETLLKPGCVLVVDTEFVQGITWKAIQERIALWLKTRLQVQLGSLYRLEEAEELAPRARGIAFRLVESLGVIPRSVIATDLKELDQTLRASLRAFGVRFGAHHVYIPSLLRPAPRKLLAQLWMLDKSPESVELLEALLTEAERGRTSLPVQENTASTTEIYRIAGFVPCGKRAVRIDVLERLADVIRKILSWKSPEGEKEFQRPEGVPTGGRGFLITPAMVSLLGCSPEMLRSVLESLGYTAQQRPCKSNSKTLVVEESPIPQEQKEQDTLEKDNLKLSGGCPDSEASERADSQSDAAIPEKEERTVALLLSNSDLPSTPLSAKEEEVEMEEVWCYEVPRRPLFQKRANPAEGEKNRGSEKDTEQAARPRKARIPYLGRNFGRKKTDAASQQREASLAQGASGGYLLESAKERGGSGGEKDQRDSASPASFKEKRVLRDRHGKHHDAQHAKKENFAKKNRTFTATSSPTSSERAPPPARSFSGGKRIQRNPADSPFAALLGLKFDSDPSTGKEAEGTRRDL